ncbi:MAG: ABC transporter ATP-binding protein [Gammaproteobacteria bacterium]|nr:ABC transporter ATP-binding protein [Gammaproteobacteria bacterium]
MTQTAEPLLTVKDLAVAFRDPHGHYTRVVEGVDFQIAPNEKLALVGESGSGKSVTALSILRLHDMQQTRFPSGQIKFQGRSLLALDEAGIRAVRGREIAMIFQEPMTSLNPVYPIGEQLIEPLMLHEGLSRARARARMLELLDRTGIPEPHKRFDAFPHMLSGGQRQRVMIAMALACSPQLLIADEPTTALDVTVQAQILALLEDVQREFGMAVLMITHDLNLVRRFADRVCVMQKGRLVEQGDVARVFAAPEHAYTRQLLNAQPQRLLATPEGTGDEPAIEARPPLLQGQMLRCYFPIKSGFFRRPIGEVKAVDDVDITLYSGETLGIVGESGSGKSTLGMCLLRLQDCTGRIEFSGQRLDGLAARALRPLRRDFQVVFQDPYASLSPRMTVEQILREGLQIHFPEQNAEQHRARILHVLGEVGLSEDMLWRYPHEFSGGQRQRIAIARAVVLQPKLILLDEPTSALDVSVQKQVLDLLLDLQRRYGLSYLFISHDLKVIRAMAHRILVMRGGRVIETGDTEHLFTQPQDSYTQTLLRASLFSDHAGSQSLLG